MKKALSILLSLIMVIGMIPMAVFSVAAEVSSDGYTLISSLSEIDSANGGKYRLKGDINGNGDTWSESIAIGADTEIDGAGFSITNFKLTADGIFSLTTGKTLTIKNLNIGANGANVTHTPSADAGLLVGTVSKDKGAATIVIENVDVYVDSSSTKPISGLVGAAWNEVKITIKDSSVNGTLTTTGTHAAGFVAYASCSVVDISNSVNNADITGNTNVGGFVGYNHNGCDATDASPDYIKIDSCTNNGDITVTGTNRAGGIVAHSTYRLAPFSITNCVNNGKVSSAVAAYTGGILGYFDPGETTIEKTVSGCINNGEVTSNSYSGGIVAYVGENVKNFTVENCINDGVVTTNAASSAGGIVAYSKCKFNFYVADCVNNKTVTSTAGSYTGGIIGYYEPSSATDSEKTVSNCVNYGDISTKNGFVGGIIGQTGSNTKNFSVIDCVNYGEVKELHSVTQSSGNGRVAGIVGQLFGSTGYVIDGCVNYGSIVNARCGGGISGLAQCATLTTKNCANFGSIESKNGAGGLFGITKGGTIVNCIVGNAEISGPAVGYVAAIAEGMGSGSTLTVDYVLNLSAVAASTNEIKGAITAEISTTTLYSISAEGATVESILNTANNSSYKVGDVTYKFTDILGKFTLNSAGTNIVPATPALQGYQVGKTETKTIDDKEVDVYSIRILATICDTLDYSYLGFNVKVNGNPVTEQSDNGDISVDCVYTSIQAANGGTMETVEAGALGGKYIYAYILKDIPVDVQVTLTINAFAEQGTGDDMVRYEAGAYTVTLLNGEVVPNAQ